MVPSAFHRREPLPLTANSKIDRKALTALAAELDVVEEDYDAPVTEAELRLAAAWATVLGVPQEEIGRRDDFFDRGGSSLSAVKVAVALDRAVSLKDITRKPVLADLAELLGGGRPESRRGLLQPLSESGADATRALVCFPHAGGNAVNFQPMARALRDSGLAVLAVELPGHDLAARGEGFAPLSQVVDQVVAEILARGLRTVLLWGHSAGTAFAVETARMLQQRGVRVERVFLASQLLGDATRRRAGITELEDRDDAEIAAGLGAAGGYTGLGELDTQRARHFGAAYRHDCVSANRHLAAALDSPPPVRLTAPVTAVVAADDPSTAGFAERHRDWLLLTEQVDLHVLADGGHHFLRTRPADAARAVLNPTVTSSS
jgi:surfactin synthase thioesterase subunit